MAKKSATIIDGKELADQWLGDIAVQVRALGVPLHLAAVCAGDDLGLKAFVKLKQKSALRSGIEFSAYYPEDENEMRQTLRWLAQDDRVHGIFVELPLPDEWDRTELLSLIPLVKDVDLITHAGEATFYQGTSSIMPPAVSALKRVMRHIGIDPNGLQAAVVGQGMLVGKPITHWLREQGGEVSIIDIDTNEPEKIAVQADLLVTGAGVPGLVTKDWVKEGAMVVDYGYAKKGDAYVGDVNAKSVSGKADALTPVPGGMGPLVVAATLKNLLALATI